MAQVYEFSRAGLFETSYVIREWCCLYEGDSGPRFHCEKAKPFYPGINITAPVRTCFFTVSVTGYSTSFFCTRKAYIISKGEFFILKFISSSSGKSFRVMARCER